MTATGTMKRESGSGLPPERPFLDRWSAGPERLFIHDALAHQGVGGNHGAAPDVDVLEDRGLATDPHIAFDADGRRRKPRSLERLARAEPMILIPDDDLLGDFASFADRDFVEADNRAALTDEGLRDGNLSAV